MYSINFLPQLGLFLLNLFLFACPSKRCFQGVWGATNGPISSSCRHLELITNGSTIRYLGQECAGGLIRDWEGKWMKIFIINIKISTSFLVATRLRMPMLHRHWFWRTLNIEIENPIYVNYDIFDCRFLISEWRLYSRLIYMHIGKGIFVQLNCADLLA